MYVILTQLSNNVDFLAHLRPEWIMCRYQMEFKIPIRKRLLCIFGILLIIWNSNVEMHNKTPLAKAVRHCRTGDHHLGKHPSRFFRMPVIGVLFPWMYWNCRFQSQAMFTFLHYQLDHNTFNSIIWCFILRIFPASLFLCRKLWTI